MPDADPSTQAYEPPTEPAGQGRRDALLGLLREARPTSAGAASRVGEYELLEKLGEGGMGVVYRARQPGLDRFVAVELMRGAADATDNERARFRLEAEAASRLNHAHIVQVHGVGEHAGEPYIVLEFVAGPNLKDLLARSLPTPADAAALLETLARALHHAHEAGIVHRDLKPANVLLRPKGSAPELPSLADYEAKVTDFGLARRLDRSALTQTGAILGTVEYMAPEQAADQGGAVGPAADVYALGVVLYECLTGRPPFRSPAVADTLWMTLFDDPVPPRRLNPQSPRDLETICLKCLRKAPTRRYASALDLAEDLKRFRNGEPIHARPAGMGERVVRWALRRPALATALVLLGVAVVALSAVWVGFTLSLDKALRDVSQERDAKDDALKTVVKEGQEKDIARADALEKLHRFKVSNHSYQLNLVQREIQDHDFDAAGRLLDGCLPEVSAWEHGHLQAACRRVLHVPRVQSDVLGISFLPDGSLLAVGLRDGTPHVWDVRTGRAYGKIPADLGPVTSVALFGRWLGCVTAEHRVLLIDLDAGAVRYRSPPGQAVQALRLSPDGKRLAVARGPADAMAASEVLIVDLEGGEPVRLEETKGAVFALSFSRDGSLLVLSTAFYGMKVWNTSTGKVRRTIPHPAPVWSIAFLDQNRFVTGSCGDLIELWDVRQGDPVRKFHQGEPSNMACFAAVSPDGQKVAGWVGRSLKIWEAESGKELDMMRWEGASSLGFSPDGRTLAWYRAGHKHPVWLWDTKAVPAIRSFELGKKQEPRGVALDATGGRMAVSYGTGQAGGVQVLDTTTDNVLHQFPATTDRVWAVAIRPDNELVVAALDGAVRAWHLGSGKDAFTLEVPGLMAYRVAFTPDGKLLAALFLRVTPDDDVKGGVAKIWDADGRREVASLDLGTSPVETLAISPDGKRLVTAPNNEPELTVWDVASGTPVRRLTGHLPSVASTCFSPDGTLLASTDSAANTAVVWDLASGREVLTLKGHNAVVHGVGFTPDGKRIVTASADRTVRLWDTTTGLEVLTIRLGGMPFWNLAVSKDGRRLGVVTVPGNKVWVLEGDPP